MTPPPLPTVPARKNGCRNAVLIVVGVLAALNIAGKLARSSQERDAARAERANVPVDPEAQRQADEAEAKRKAEVAEKRKAMQAASAANQPPAPANTPASQNKPAPPAVEALTARQQIEKQLKENAASIFKDGVKDCTAWESTPPGKWDMLINVVESEPRALTLQGDLIKLAAICHPEGFKVGMFRVAVFSDFNDGLGNTSQGSLLRVTLKPDVQDRINWKNPDAIVFHRAFETDKVHRSFKEEWEAVGD